MASSVEMKPLQTDLDRAKTAADAVLDKHNDKPNIKMTITNLSTGRQLGEFQDDNYAYITKADFDALNALRDAYNLELSRAENEYYRKQMQILMELLVGIKGAHPEFPEFSGGSKKRSKKRSNRRSKKSRSRRTISRRRARAAR
jgi:hypothetical protein